MKSTILTRPNKLSWIVFSVLLAILIISAVFTIANTFPFGPDWTKTYRPAAHELLHGKNPHEKPPPRFLNATWMLLPIVPIALLPTKIGGAIFLLAGIVGFSYGTYRLGATPSAMGLFLVSPPVLHCLLNGNIDWVTILGCTLNPQIGLFLVLAKPQMGFTVAIFWFVEAWREGGWRKTAQVFAPVTIAFLITFVLFGFWPEKWVEQPEEWWNASLWPYSIPFGLGLIYLALKRRKFEFAMPAGPALSPYVIFHSWSIAIASVVSNTRWTLIVVLGLWGLIVLRIIVG